MGAVHASGIGSCAPGLDDEILKQAATRADGAHMSEESITVAETAGTAGWRTWFVRPIQSPRPILFPWSVVLSLLMLGGLASIIVTISRSGVDHLLAVGVLALVFAIGELLVVRVSDSIEFTCSDAFLIVAIVALPSADAAAVILVGGMFAFAVARSSWLTAVAHAGNVWGGGMIALGAVTAFLHAFGQGPVQVLCAGVLTYVVANLPGYAIYAGDVLTRPSHLMSNIAKRPTGREVIREILGSYAVQIVIQVPVGVLGVFALAVAPWTALLALTPFLAVWYATRQASALADARRRMYTDGLTGLTNRAGFFDHAEQELYATRADGDALVLIMGDLDNFKRINDELGHLTGDEVLRRTARVFMDARDQGARLVGRYGGEEFVAVLVGASREEAIATAGKIRASIEESLLEYGTTISLGVAYLQDSDRLESIVDRADKALYAAKFAGKNRVYHWFSGMSVPIDGSVPEEFGVDEIAAA